MIDVLLFTSKDCVPCKQLKAALKAKNYDFSKMQQIDVDEVPEQASYYKVNSVPTVIFMEKNGPSHTVSGYVPALISDIMTWKAK